jgi:ABC-type oligopeptide transport system substrate-binding subunit
MANKFQGLMVFILITMSVSCVPKNKKSGNTINYNIGGEPTTLSPLSASDMYSSNIHDMPVRIQFLSMLQRRCRATDDCA